MASRKKKTRTGFDLKELGKTAFRLKKEGKFREAESKFTEVLNRDPNNTYALVGIGDLKRVKRDFFGSSSVLQKMY